MNRLMQLLLVSLLILSSCGKGETGKPDPVPNEKQEFEVTDIKADKDRIVAGQRIVFTPTLTDGKGNVVYEWKLFFDGKQVGQTLFGDHSVAKVNFSEVGEYTIRLTITRGESDKNVFEKRVLSIAPYFEFGVWGDSQKTIEDAEADNGNEKHNGLVGVPVITDGNQGLTYITYKKSGNYYTYYFRDGVLYAGGATHSFSYYNGADMRGVYSRYVSKKSDFGNFIRVELTESREWSTTQSQIEYYESSSTAMSQAIGYGYLELYSRGRSGKGTATVDLFKSSATNILLRYILISE